MGESQHQPVWKALTASGEVSASRHYLVRITKDIPAGKIGNSQPLSKGLLGMMLLGGPPRGYRIRIKFSENAHHMEDINFDAQHLNCLEYAEASGLTPHENGHADPGKFTIRTKACAVGVRG